MKRLALLPVLAAALFIGAAAANAAEEARIERQVRRLAQPFIDAQRVQSMTIGVVHGEKRYTFAFGQLSAADKTKPDERTLYEIGSVTKTMTALLLADETARGRLALDTPINDLLPAGVKAPAGEKRPITLADLATHHSGLVGMPGNFTPANAADPYADYTAKLMHEFIRGTTLLTEPGENYLYSNLGSALLGEALARRAGEKYERLLAERLFKPLGMNDTTIALSAEQRKRFAPPHTADGDPAKPWNLAAFNPAGGVRSNVSDMLRYVEAQLGKRKSKLDGAIGVSHKRRHDIPGGAIALGWHIAGDRKTYWHNGQTGGYHSMVMFNKSLDAGVVILANSSTHEIDQLGGQIIRMIGGHDEKPATFKKPVKVDRKILERYAGVYIMAPTVIVNVRLRGERLYVQLTGQDAYAIYPESPTRFHYRVVPATITFELDDNDAVHRLILHQNGRDIPAVRKRDDGEK